MSLPIFKTEDKDLSMLQTKWSSELNPLLIAVLNNGQLLQNISLVSGSNTVNHKLGRKLIGWFFTRVRANQTAYDTQDSNQHPERSLLLTASGSVTVDIFVF